MRCLAGKFKFERVKFDSRKGQIWVNQKYAVKFENLRRKDTGLGAQIWLNSKNKKSKFKKEKGRKARPNLRE